MDRLTEETVRGAVARGWCDPANSHKEMDSTLAESITREVLALNLSQEAVRDEALEEAAKVAEQFTEPTILVFYDRPRGPPGNARVPLTGKAHIAPAIRALKREPNAAPEESVSARTEVCRSATEKVSSAPADDALKPPAAAPDRK